jgi:hypothetical protein
LFAAVFTLAAVFLLDEGVTTGNYILVALVLVAYAFVLMLEVSLALRTRQPKSSRPTPRGRLRFASECKQMVERLSMES